MLGVANCCVVLLPVSAFHPQELGDGFAMCVVLGIERSQFDA